LAKAPKSGLIAIITPPGMSIHETALDGGVARVGVARA